MKESKVISMLVVIALVLSTLMFTTAVADRKEVTTDGNADWILSNDGFGSQAKNLTCGETITLQITNNSLEPDTQYYLGVWNGTEWKEIKTVSTKAESDDYGDISVDFYVPGWSELNHCPTTANGTGLTESVWPFNLSAGQWNISLFTSSTLNETNKAFSDMNITIQIGNLYMLEYYYQGEEIDHLIYNTSYSVIIVEIHNWTGTKYELVDGDDFNCAIYAPGPTLEEASGSAVSDGTWEVGFQVNEDDITIPNYEVNYWVNVTVVGSSSHYSNMSLPVLVNMTCTYPTDAVWGDTIDLSGYILEGINSDPVSKGIAGYDFNVYAPNNDGGYDLVYYDDTNFEGYYSAQIKTGSGESACAGTWYLGTWDDSATGRVDMSDEPPYKDGFIPYHSFEVGTKELDEDTVDIENTDDIVKDFGKTINVSVAKESWMDNYEFQNMSIHFTDIEANYSGVEYGRNDIVQVTPTVNRQSDIAYYEFDITFLETGTGTILVSYPGNLTEIQGTDEVNSVTSSYSDRFGNHSTSLIANITGSTTFSVVSPDAMTVLVENAPEAVEVERDFDTGWQNISSDGTLVSVYGSTEDSHKNATIQVTGCGLDFTINETDTSHDNLIEKYFDDAGNGAWYNVSIIPKTAGTLTIAVTNGTTVTKDYTVTGLTGTVSTSVGDDLEIEVGSTETITIEGVTEYAQATVTLFDETWGSPTRLNYSEEAGEFTFTPEADDIGQIGYIVVVAGVDAWDQYMYDIIEVVPVDDLMIDVTTPSAGNQTLTVGMEQELIVKFLDENGDAVTEEDPTVEAKLIDADNDEDDPLQEFTMDDNGDGEWSATITPYYKGQLLISGYNASSGIKHIGETTLDVDYATVTYSPDGATAGLDTEDITVEVTAVDANGNPLDVTTLHLHAEDDSGNLDFDSTVNLTDGTGEFDIAVVGDLKTYINATLDSATPANGNRTLGKFNIDFPNFDINPDTIYIGQSNEITITATDINGDPVKGLNLTLWGATLNGTGNQPDPVKTDSDGEVIFSITPSSSGVVNVTIARNLEYVGGELTWTDAVITDSYITITSIKTFQISLSKSPITEGETLTVTVTDGTNPVSSANVEFAGTTQSTDSDGKATFTAPDPMVESVTYYVEVTKEGYTTKDKGVTVVKKYEMSIAGPSGDVETGKSFTVTVISKGSSLAGATVTFEGTTVTSDGDGKATFTAPDTKGTYEVTASHEDYTEDATLDIKVKKAEGGTPGFELLTLIAAIGVAFILLRRRRNK